MQGQVYNLKQTLFPKKCSTKYWSQQEKIISRLNKSKFNLNFENHSLKSVNQ